MFARLLCAVLFAASWPGACSAQFAPPPIDPLATFPLPDWGTSVAFSPDGKTLAIGTYERVLLVDVAGRRVARTIAVHSGYVRGADWSADGRFLATTCFQALQIWTAEGEPVQILKLRGYGNSVQFSPDSVLVAAAGEDGAVSSWSTTDFSELPRWTVGVDPLLAVAFSPDGQWLAAVGGDDTRLTRAGTVRMLSLQSRDQVITPDVRPELCATDAAYSPDGGTLYVADLNKRVTLYDAVSGEARAFFGKHARPVNAVAPLADGRTVVSGSGGRYQKQNEIKVWNAADGDELATIDHHAGKVSGLAVSPDESLLASVSFDKTAALWDLAAMTPSAAKPEAAAGPTANPSVSSGPAAPALAAAPAALAAAPPAVLKIGVIGLDTSHATAFTALLNADPPAETLRGLRVVAAYPQGSADIESSVSRIPEYTAEVQKHGVEIVESIDQLLARVDCVLLETNDGRPHLAQVLPVLKAHKPVFVDKPMAASLSDVIAIFDAARQLGTPVFSSSSLRYVPGAQAARGGSLGQVLGCDAYSPCHLEATHPDLFWYGIHGVEELYTVMGTGCHSVSRTSTEDFDFAVGVWSGGRIGTFRGIRKGASGYGGTVFGEKGLSSLGDYAGYEPLVVQIAEFFRGGREPVSAEETIELYAFMAAADESKRQGGVPVTLDSVLTPAREQAAKSLDALLAR